MQSRETLRQSEQDALAAASTAYMNVLRDTALLELQNNNVTVLKEQVKQTEDRYRVGEVTRTDVAQAGREQPAEQNGGKGCARREKQ